MATAEPASGASVAMAAVRGRSSRGCWIGGVHGQRRARTQVPLAVRNELVVRRPPHQRDELAGGGEVERLWSDVCLGVAGAVPVEVVAARAPAPPVVLLDGHLGVGRPVLQLDGA